MLIDWRAWLLTALARRLGFRVCHVGEDPTTGERAFIFAASKTSANALAFHVCVRDAMEREQLARAEQEARREVRRKELGVH